MNIVVLCGGLSNEREVSISSGTAVVSALRKRGHKAILVDLFLGISEEFTEIKELFDRPWVESTHKVQAYQPDLAAVRKSRKNGNTGLIGEHVLEVCRAADITFFALHGEEGENGKLQALFDIEGIKYTGSGYLGSAVAMNKYLTKQVLQASGIGTAKGIILNRGNDELKNVGFPCVVKPCSGGSSVGTSIVSSADEYEEAVRQAFKYEENVLVEQFIEGREFTVGVMAGKAMPVIEIIPKNGFYDYKNKYQAGATIELCPAPISATDTQKLQQNAEMVFKTLLIEVYCRVDFIMTAEGTVICLEANTLPGMTGTSLIPQMASAQGMDFGELCELIITESMKKYQ